jgi:hypothetical protein
MVAWDVPQLYIVLSIFSLGADINSPVLAIYDILSKWTVFQF